MKLRTWPILVLAFGVLVALIAISGMSALARAERLFREISALHQRYQSGEKILSRIRSEIHISGLLVRDYLLDRSNLTAKSYRDQLVALRAAIPAELDELKGNIGVEETTKLNRLNDELEGYWNSLDPIFEWTPEDKLALSSSFLRRKVLPRRNAALEIARELRDLNEANLDRQRKAVIEKEKELPQFVGRMLTVTLIMGLLVAVGSIYHINRLEQRSEVQRQRTEAAEWELRRLSQKQVRSQEDERRHISRELHDEVGQMLTAQRMEIRNLKLLRTAPEEEFLARLEDMARLSENALRAVRDIAMGLRPSMLDDIGLAPAIEWQAREFSRRYGVPVGVQLDGPIASLPDTHRTCVYRAVQEALTNCARHARAKEIRIAIHGHEDLLSITIQDDGVGFKTEECRGRGFGLLGIDERVRELGGVFRISSQPGKGAVLSAEIPVRTEVPQT